MKKLFSLAVLLLCITALSAQAPEGLNYQAVARDGNGALLQNQSIDITFSIRSGAANGVVVYVEDHTLSTNDYGLFTAIIGDGTPSQGTFAAINWGVNSHYLQVEIDAGSGKVDLGTTQLMSVPYALYAKEAGNGSVWKTTGSDVYYNAGNIGVGTTTPSKSLEVDGEFLVSNGQASIGTNTDASGQYFEVTKNNIVANQDALTIQVQNGAPDNGQFIEFQRGNSVEARINTNGSAEFQNVALRESTSTPSINTAYANALPLAYGAISSIGSILTDYGIASVSSGGVGVYNITLDNSWSGTPVVIVTTLNNSATVENATYSTSGSNSITVRVSNSSNNPTSSNFSIIVMGTAQ